MDKIEAHRFSSNHKESLQKSTSCGCFYCCSIFTPKEITQWIDKKGVTALCPICRIDSVVGDADGVPITLAFLKEMNNHWFSFKGFDSGTRGRVQL